jgi:hypothetical protein
MCQLRATAFILSRVGVIIRRGLDWMFGFIALIHSTRNYKKYSAIANLRTLQFNAANTNLLSMLSLVVS